METKIRPVPRVKRKRGGQPGNRNRWIHGLYSTQLRRRSAELDVIIRQCDVVIEIAMALAAQRALVGVSQRVQPRHHPVRVLHGRRTDG
jgi:hypothetical protein